MLKSKRKLPGFYSLIFSLSIPIILQNLMQTFINMLDTIMVGRLGAVEIASVGLGNQIYFMMIMVIFGITSGGAIFISQFWGQNNIKGIRHTTGIMNLLALCVSVLFMVTALFWPEFLLSLYSKDSAVIEQGAHYLRIVALSYPLNAVSFSFQMSFRSTEHVYLPMACTGVSLVLNALLNFVLIFGIQAHFGSFEVAVPALGTLGAALATLISRLVEFFIVIFYSYSHKFECCGSIKEMLSFDFLFVKKIFKVAIPVIISETLWGLGITFQNGIYARTGTDVIAAFNIMNTVSQLTWVFFIGMGNASAIILGKKIGSGQTDEAHAYAARFCWFMPLSGAVIALLLFPISFLLPHIFNVDNSIILIARSMMYVLICVYPLRAFNMLLIVGICRAGGDTLFGMIDDNGCMWLISIPLGFAAAFFWKFSPWLIMLCLESEQLVKASFGLWRIKTGKWLHNLTE